MTGRTAWIGDGARWKTTFTKAIRSSSMSANAARRTCGHYRPSERVSGEVYGLGAPLRRTSETRIFSPTPPHKHPEPDDCWLAVLESVAVVVMPWSEIEP